jgi:nicotinamidase-related amidase
MQRPALLVIDMLNDFLGKWDPARRNKLICAINELVQMMRRASRPVIWVRQEFEPDLSDAFLEMRAKGIRVAIRGTAGAQLVSELALASSDAVIVKKRYSAFFGTDLDEILRRLQPDTLVIAGVNTHACIRTTAIDAYQRDWHVVLASDCIDSYDSEHHDVSLKYMKDKIATLQSNREIEAMLA